MTKKQIFAILLIISAGSYTLYAVFRYFLADVYYARGQKMLRTFSITQDPQDILSAYDAYTQAWQLNPTEPAIGSDLAIVASYLSVLSSEAQPEASQTLIELAQSASAKAIAASPNHPNYYKTRARLFIVLSSLDPKYLKDADLALSSAEKTSPTDPRLPYMRATVAQYAEDSNAALSHLSRALALKPDFADALRLQTDLATASASTP